MEPLMMNGKCNYATIWTHNIDITVQSQIMNMLNHPAFAKSFISIMPDVHAGAGAVIGFTMRMNEYIIPNVIGVDINCGMLAINMSKNIDTDWAALDNFIRQKIPHGFSIRNEEYNNIYNICALRNKIEEVSKKLEINTDYMQKSLGTLGGGNHFIEVNIDKAGNYWLVVHTGSRKFGYEIANYHQNKAKELMKVTFNDTAYSNLEFLPIGYGAEEYIDDMKVAQEFADMNREIIIKEILNFLNAKQIDKIHSKHNYIDFEDKIIRKGATRAHEGEKLIIPLNMKDGSIIATGKGNSRWNNSAPHGAGRIYSRRKAREELSIDKFKEDMKDVWTSCVKNDTIDEAPEAYKPSQEIIDAVSDSVDIIDIIKPVYNFKAN